MKDDSSSLLIAFDGSSEAEAAIRAAAVVVDSHWRSAFGAMLTGSVSRALVHYAPAPVLVVRPPRARHS